MERRVRKVLLVEDDLATLSVMRRLFIKSGWMVSQAKSVAGALRQLHTPPHWIVLDLGLTDGDGVEVLRRVRADGISCRVVVVSGRLDIDRMANLCPLHPDALIPKPVDFDRLLELCRTIR